MTFSDQEEACHLAFCETAWHEIVEPKTDNNTVLNINAASCIVHELHKCRLIKKKQGLGRYFLPGMVYVTTACFYFYIFLSFHLPLQCVCGNL